MNRSQHSPDPAPVSVFSGPVAGLLTAGLIGPPAQPGLLGRVDKYDLLRVLGQGGMGIVFLARDNETGAQVAVKLPRPEFAGDAELVGRFLREARRLQELNHPNLVRVLDVRELKQGGFFVMPYFDRGSLAPLIRPGVPLARQAILEILVPVAEALKVIHSGGLTHRDIKPGNILLGSDGSVCLADFGLARTVFNDSVIRVGEAQCEGTPAYMSPQMVNGEKEDTRCDIYAFGALVYEMLTGKPPYQDQTTNEIRARILAGPPKPIAEVNPGADPGLVSLAQGAMAREQRDRYANMSDLMADLVRLQAGKRPAGPQRKSGLVREGMFWLHRIPRSVRLSACLGGIALLSWILWPHERLKVEWNFRHPLIRNWDDVVLGDWRGDKRAALYIADDTNFLVFSHEGEVLVHVLGDKPGIKNLRVDMSADLKGAGRDPAGAGRDAPFLSWSSGTNLNVVVLDRPPATELRPSVERRLSPESTLSPKMVRLSSYKPKSFSDLGHAPNAEDRDPSDLRAVKVVPWVDDNRTRHLFLARILTGYGKIPRGLSCFDFESSEFLWRYSTGPCPNEVKFVDLKGDGQSCFVFGSGAPDNGQRMEDGTDDSHAYIFAVSTKGEILWKWQRRSSPGFAGVQPLVADLNGDGREEVLAWGDGPAELNHNNHSSEVGLLVQLDEGGHVTNYYKADACLQSCLAVDLDGDGKQEIVCTDCQGRVHLLNADLSSRRVVPLVPRKYDHVELNVVTAIDSGKGREPRLVFRSSQHDQMTRNNADGKPSLPLDKFRRSECTIFVTDRAFTRKASYFLHQEFTEKTPFGWEVKVADMDGDSLDEILSLTDHVEILKLKR